jgi:cell shape-determining protein MreC
MRNAMNANELADYLDEFYKNYVPNDAFEKAATMLRQQQAEIEAVKAENERLFASMITMALDEEVRKANEK